MAVAGHDQSAAVLVTELDADREVIETELEQLRGAEVAQVVPADVRDVSPSRSPGIPDAARTTRQV
jgi:hypothetical protein